MNQIIQAEEIPMKKPSEVVGSEPMHNFATFWFKNTDALKSVQTDALVDFCERYEFTKDEYDAFKRGVVAVIDFFYNSYMEREELKFKAFQESSEAKKEK